MGNRKGKGRGSGEKWGQKEGRIQITVLGTRLRSLNLIQRQKLEKRNTSKN